METLYSHVNTVRYFDCKSLEIIHKVIQIKHPLPLEGAGLPVEFSVGVQN